MKRLFTILAFAGILLQTFHQVVIVAEYFANKDYIAKNLCENRNKPQMHCDGKCCLKKKLAKAAKDEAPSPRNQKGDDGVVLFCEHPDFTINGLILPAEQKIYYAYNDLTTSSFHSPVFHPPGA